VNGRSARLLPADVRLAAFDVDGVFTDGRFYLSDDGVESKAFSTQDGYGIKQLLAADIHVAIISSRKSQAVAHRMSELGVRHVIQGASDKAVAFESLLTALQLSSDVCVYVGDDIPDLPVLKRVGFAIAVANAVDEVKQQSDLTTRAAGGCGAVREVCELLLRARAARQSSDG
jgi:3-deoxy-D-manno-octulosonate 8-phosphate phosphatase (KDO 8-P phosphatase)